MRPYASGNLATFGSKNSVHFDSIVSTVSRVRPRQSRWGAVPLTPALHAYAVAFAVIDADALVVDRQLLAVVQIELHEPFTAVVERQRMALARLDLTDVVVAIRIGLRCLVFLVPKRSNDVGEAEITAVERDEHFVLEFGNGVDAAAVAGMGVATRAQRLSCGWLRPGYVTWTRPSPVLSLFCLTIATDTPLPWFPDSRVACVGAVARPGRC